MTEKKKELGKKILVILAFACGALTFDKISNYFLNLGNLKVVGAMLALSLFGLGIYFRKKMQASFFQILSYYMVVVLFGIYVFYTLLNPVLKETTMFSSLKMSLTEMNSFLSIFSLTYGVTQLFGGYILSRFKLFGYTAMMVLGALSIFGQTMFINSSSCVVSRLLSGVFLSVSGIIVSYYPAKFWPKENINFLINSIIFLGVKLACIGANVAFLVAQKNPMSWKTILTQNSLIMGGVAIVFAFFVLFFGKPVNEQIIEKKHQKNEGSILGEFFGLLFKDKKIILACIFCAGTVMQFYFFRFSGYLVELMSSFFPGESAAAAMNLFNSSNTYALLFGPMLLALISVESVLLLFSSVQILSIIPLLFFAKSSAMVILFAAVGMGFGMAAHTFPPILFGVKYGEKRSAGLLFALLNFFPMFLGSYVGQKVGMYLAQKSWIASGATMSQGKALISGQDVMFSIKCIFPASALAFIIAIYLFVTRKQK